MKQPVDVVIMGHRLTVTSDDGAEHVCEVAGDVDQKMRKLAEGRGGTTMVQLALLTALNIASECRKLSSEREELHRVIDRLSKRISQGADKRAVGKENARHGEEDAPPAKTTRDSLEEG